MEEQETITKSEIQVLLVFAFLFMVAGILLQNGSGIGVSGAQILRSEVGFLLFWFWCISFRCTRRNKIRERDLMEEILHELGSADRMKIWKISAFILLVIIILAFYSSSVNGYVSDIQLNITNTNYNFIWFNSSSNQSVNMSVNYTNYSLYPYELNLFQNTTKTIEINNLDYISHNVSFDLIGLNAQVIWAGGYDLVNGSSKYGAVTFNEIGAGFFRINISGLNTTLLSQPALKINITAPLILPKIDFYLGVHECRNFTIVENSSGVRNITICGDKTSCGWDDLNPNAQQAQISNLSSALQAWLAALNNQTGILNGTNLTSYKYYWEVTPEAAGYLNELKNLKSCDAAVLKARNELTDFYTGEIKKKNAEFASESDAKIQCLLEKKTALENSDKYNLVAIDCEKTKRNETEAAVESMRRNEVLPAVGVAGLLIAFVFIVAIYRQYKNMKPEKMFED